MAGNIIDMSRIKQLLQLKKLGLSNRQIAKELKISRDKTNEYVRMAELDSLDIDALLRLDDPVLEKRFHPGNPAYTDRRMETFLELLVTGNQEYIKIGNEATSKIATIVHQKR